jgi:hypothetical protein
MGNMVNKVSDLPGENAFLKAEPAYHGQPELLIVHGTAAQ